MPKTKLLPKILKDILQQIREANPERELEILPDGNRRYILWDAAAEKQIDGYYVETNSEDLRFNESGAYTGKPSMLKTQTFYAFDKNGVGEIEMPVETKRYI
jgi:hypothetical protein